MDKYYVLVVGNGSTSRQNVEALMEDHYYANGDSGVLVIPVDKAPTQSQIFVAQFAKEKNKEIVFVANENTNLTNVPASSVVIDDDPLNKAVEIVIGEKVSAFLLWSDDDQTSLEALSACKKANIPCFDLTNGLTVINAADSIPDTQKIKFPDAEIIKERTSVDAEKEEVDEEEDYEEEFDEEDDDSEDEDYENLYAGVEAIARIFARVFLEEMEAAKNGPKS
jgi:hypothetical protein